MRLAVPSSPTPRCSCSRPLVPKGSYELMSTPARSTSITHRIAHPFQYTRTHCLFHLVASLLSLIAPRATSQAARCTSKTGKMQSQTYSAAASMSDGNCEQMTFVFNLNTIHPHASTVEDWAASILGTSTPPTHFNWVEDPLRERESPQDWLATRSQEEIDTFYHVGIGMFLSQDAIKCRPELKDLASKAIPR
jgi:hypothetical protein